MRRRGPLHVLLGVVVLWAASLAFPHASTAMFTASTNNVATVGAAVDWTPPSVTMQNPGSPLQGTVSLTATASDGETGIASVTIEYLPLNGSAWVPACTDTAAPYACDWSSKTVADGSYDVRARALDNAGYTATSTPVRTTVANNLLVVLGDPGDVLRGTVSLPTTLYNAGSTTYTVRVEYSPAGTGTWRSVCSNLAAPYSCTWNTTTFANDYVDLRAVATAGGTSTYSAVVNDVLVDNQAPIVAMGDPGSPLGGTRTFSATSSDGHSGVASVAIQYAVQGTTTYKTLCTVPAEPYSCRFDTTALLDGTYSFRAVATDVAGNTATSAAVGNRVVDNSLSSVSMDPPAAYLSGTVSLSATANSTAGVQGVRIQVAPSGSTSWTEVCTDVVSPYTCSWDTTTVTDGLYDFRAVLTDGAGRTTPSTVESGRRVDNSPLRGADVQTTNGGASAGRLDNGDLIRLTYTDQVSLASLTSSWAGSPVAVTVRLRDGNLVGLTNKGDTLDVLRNGTAVNLGSVNLKEDYVKGSRTASFNATMTAGTTAVNGLTSTTVSIQLTGLASGGGLRTVSNPTHVAWTPSASATDLYGNPASTAPTIETGVLDREF